MTMFEIMAALAALGGVAIGLMMLFVARFGGQRELDQALQSLEEARKANKRTMR